MNKKYPYLLIIALIGSLTHNQLYGQDLLIMRDGQEYECQVVSIKDDYVNYKMYSNLEGPIYSKKISDIFMIKYENGEKEVFKISIEDTPEKDKNNKFSEFTDQRDGNIYKAIKIGDQVWMAQNLNYMIGGHDCDGMENDICIKCGQFYNYREALIACPAGWHLPSDNEWIQLEMDVGMANVEAMKNGWRGTPPGQAYVLLDGGKSELDLGICGYMVNKKQYYEKEAFYWTATLEDKDHAWMRHFQNRASIEKIPMVEKLEMSVRCMKDKE